jgi:hypothetical protein
VDVSTTRTPIAFLAAGFGKDHLLEVIAASTITNYAGSITKPPLEAPSQDHAWLD